jgi:hypothetical protein
LRRRVTRGAQRLGGRLDERSGRLDALLFADRREPVFLAYVAHPGPQRRHVLVVLATRRGPLRDQPILHGEKCDGARFVAARRDHGNRRRQRRLRAAQHFAAEFAGAHEVKRAVDAREPPLGLPDRKSIFRVRHLTGNHAGQKPQPFRRRLTVSEQFVERGRESLVGDGGDLDRTLGGRGFGRSTRSGVASPQKGAG